MRRRGLVSSSSVSCVAGCLGGRFPKNRSRTLRRLDALQRLRGDGVRAHVAAVNVRAGEAVTMLTSLACSASEKNK
jgi:hypothetical protein